MISTAHNPGLVQFILWYSTGTGAVQYNTVQYSLLCLSSEGSRQKYVNEISSTIVKRRLEERVCE